MDYFWGLIVFLLDHTIFLVANQKKKGRKAGYVYLIRGGQYWKIGRTKDLKDRMETFGLTLPMEVEYEHTIKTDNMYKLEKDLHKRYADKRIRDPYTNRLTEWFNLDSSDVAEIKKI